MTKILEFMNGQTNPFLFLLPWRGKGKVDIPCCLGRRRKYFFQERERTVYSFMLSGKLKKKYIYNVFLKSTHKTTYEMLG